MTGSFACRDAVAGAIHANVVRGQLANLMSAPTDCPQRGERMGWLGDAQLASEEACCNFDMAAFYAKYLEDIRHAQRPDGSLSDVVPPYWPIYPADPAWASAYPALAWAMYWHYGDAQTLERHYEPVRRYVDFLHASAEGNILRSLGSYGDWCPPGSVFPKRTPVEFTSTWYLCHDTFLFARIAAALGRSADAALYETRAREVARAFNERYLGDDGRYAIATTSPIDRSVAQTNQALPLALGIVPAELRERVAGHLVAAVVKNADCHIDAGIVGARYIPEVLADLGYADLAWRMITTTTYPGWGYMVAEGATTLWERWEKLAGQGMNSHNHIMFGSVDAWFYRCLAGIVPLEPGWTRVRIAPHAPASLGHASASRMTPRGRISVSWSEGPGPAGGAHEAGASGRSGPGPFRLAVSIPDGVSACVALPPGDAGRELREGGRPVWGAQAAVTMEAAEGRGGAYPGGIRAVRAAGNLVEVEIGSGDYDFELLR